MPLMTEHSRNPVGEEPRGAPDVRARPKKPYEAPRVVSHSALEVITGACTPQPPGKAEGACTFANS